MADDKQDSHDRSEVRSVYRAFGMLTPAEIEDLRKWAANAVAEAQKKLRRLRSEGVSGGMTHDGTHGRPKKRSTYQASGLLTLSEQESLRAWAKEAGALAQRELAKLAK